MKRIEKLYQDYLIRVGLTEAQMGIVQQIEMRRIFFGCAASMLVLFRDEIGKLPEKQATLAMYDLWNEVVDYWKTQIK